MESRTYLARENVIRKSKMIKSLRWNIKTSVFEIRYSVYFHFCHDSGIKLKLPQCVCLEIQDIDIFFYLHILTKVAFYQHFYFMATSVLCCSLC